MYAFNLQLQMHKYYFDILIYYLTNKKKVECEIKTTSRWQQVTVNKWVIAIEPNHLNRWNETRSETQNSAVAVFGIIFVLEIEQKQPIWCLKCYSLN